MLIRIFVEPQQGADYAAVAALAIAAEERGFDGFFCSDHVLRIPEVSGGDGRPGPLDAWTTLAGLAVQTHTIRLGTLMSAATFRTPGLLAVQVAQVDRMSGGRVEVGLGAGWYEPEHLAYGIPFPPVVERFDRYAEQLAILVGLWGTPDGETFDFDGRHYRLRDCPALPRPAQSPRPRLIVGGRGRRRTPALAARFADEFNVPSLPLPQTVERYQRVREACADQGRSPDAVALSITRVVCLGRGPQEVSGRLARIGRPERQIREKGLVGSPAEVADALSAAADAGVQRCYAKLLDVDDLGHLDQLRAVADQLR